MTTLETKVEAVTVYPDRAAVTRRGQLELAAGVHQIVVEGLPVTLAPESLRASGRGTARARLLSVRAERTFYTRPPVASLADLEARREKLSDQDRELADRQKELEGQESFLASLATSAGENLAKGLAFGRADVETLNRFTAFVESSRAENHKRLREVQLRRREIAREIAKVEQELEQVRSSRPLERYRAVVNVEIVIPGTLDLELVYMVSGARWEPVYDLRLKETKTGAEVELGYLSQVSQKTGEDWSDASLALSTAKPAITAQLPKLEPWYIQPYTPPQMLRAAPAPAAVTRGPALAAVGAGVEAEEAMRPAEIQEMESAMAEIKETGASLTYAVKQPVTIPSDGAPHETAIATLSLSPQLDYVTAPRIASYAYRRAKIVNSSDLILLPGKLNIFWGNEYVGTSRLDNVAPGQEFEVFLGVDERIRVERKLVGREVDKRLLANRRRTQYGYRITLQNLRERQVSITVLDQIPVSRHEDIKVQPGRPNISPEEDAEMGIWKWTLTLPPGEKRVIEYDFAVEYPREMRVVGLLE